MNALIAKALRSVRPTDVHPIPQNEYDRMEQWRLCVKAVSSAYAKMNPSFREDLFLEACGSYLDALEAAVLADPDAQ